MTWNEVHFHSSVGDVKTALFLQVQKCVMYFILDQLRTIHGNNDQAIKFNPTLVEFWHYIKTSKTLVTLLCLDIFITYLTLLSPIIWIYEKYDYTFFQLNFCNNRKMCWYTQTPSLKCKIPSCIILWFWYQTPHISHCCHTSQCCTWTLLELHAISITYRLHAWPK
jgi:hypothetical protein